ncbi:MAG: hypothetical protein IID37_02690 [Planctomycetes bacterium]|nr:hypothetical protein [Planctomycetota bacterium]
MLDWISSHDTLLWWLAVLSVISFVGSLIVIPILAVRIPADYFTGRTRHPTAWKRRHPIIRISILTAKNVFGVAFVLAGVGMLVLPGQGVVTVVIGLMLMDFPGKFAIQRWLIRRGPVHRALNWIRAKTDRPPLEIPANP